MTRTEYINSYKDLAVLTTAGTGLFPSVMLAQAIVESNNGNSVLAKKYNNHFGIKANSSWSGKKVNLNTREVISGNDITIGAYFRVYDTVEQSYIDRVNFLRVNPRYQTAGVFSATTPLEQLEALQRAGYATDPRYASTLNQVLTGNNLSVLDQIKETLGIIQTKIVQTTKDSPIVVVGIVILFIALIYFLYKKP